MLYSIIEKPVVRNFGLSLHEAIKKSIHERAKATALILGQQRMCLEPFVLKVCIQYYIQLYNILYYITV